MSNPYVAEIRMFAGNFAPKGWALCNGQILPISQNTALFSLLGTQYGGNGTSNFALPNVQGSAPMGQGNGAGLTPRAVGETGGETIVTLLETQMASHNHPVSCLSGSGAALTPGGNIWADAASARGQQVYSTAAGSQQTMDSGVTQASGNSQPHNNMSPYLTVTFIIALQGVFPPRN